MIRFEPEYQLHSGIHVLNEGKALCRHVLAHYKFRVALVIRFSIFFNKEVAITSWILGKQKTELVSWEIKMNNPPINNVPCLFLPEWKVMPTSASCNLNKQKFMPTFTSCNLNKQFIPLLDLLGAENAIIRELQIYDKYWPISYTSAAGPSS